jgi:hypothetical protein
MRCSSVRASPDEGDPKGWSLFVAHHVDARRRIDDRQGEAAEVTMDEATSATLRRDAWSWT